MTPYFESLQPESISGAQLDAALSLGWYRMHQGIFTTSHVDLGGIYRVHWLRYPLAKLIEWSSHKRIRNRNKRFSFTIEDFNPADIRMDHKILHALYRASIDFDGAISIEDCLLGEGNSGVNIFNTKCISVFENDKLIAGGYLDVGEKSAASILHFFDPIYARYSLGKFLMLISLDYLKEEGYSYYYPGYVVQGLEKMNYKLFVGKELAEYFDPETISWKNFQESILRVD